jgi:hypothetical protein
MRIRKCVIDNIVQMKTFRLHFFFHSLLLLFLIDYFLKKCASKFINLIHFILPDKINEMSRMVFIKWLGLEVAVEFFNRYLLFPLTFFVMVSIYRSHHALHYKIIGIFLTVILFAGSLSLEEKGKKKVLSPK